MKKKILIITPHLSTGGAPQYTYNRILLLKDEYEIKVIEHSFLAWCFVVQRNRIRGLVGESNFYSLGENKFEEFKNIFESFNPDIVSLEELPEMFMESTLTNFIYASNRTWKIYETTHDSSFNPKNKIWQPDEYIFVSPYSALKYSHQQVPINIIEYPIELKERNQKQARDILGLEHDYKHIVIVGLFTPRKNQAYAFDIAKRLHDKKVKFHFIGNQAENFSFYWKPLMDSKPSNCIIWGERDDTETFYQASDLFLFPSKGDSGNKELNPLVIKESLQYQNLPKLFYNLDVYLNRYNNHSNVNYLSGNIEADIKLVCESINLSLVDNHEDVIILGTYPNLESRVKLTKDTINSLKPLNRKIMLVSHYQVDEEIQKMVDYYIFDNHNPLTHHSYYTKFYNYQQNYDVEININGLKNTNQSLCVLTNMFNGVKFAKSLGFVRFFYTTYDVVLHEKDIPQVEKAFKVGLKNSLYPIKAYLGSLNTPFGKGVQTNGMGFEIDFFLNTFDDVRNEDEYNTICQKIGAQNFLEDYLIKKLNFLDNKYTFEHNVEETLLKHSGLGVASNSEYYSIVPIVGKPNKYMFYFYTYNIDERKVVVTIQDKTSNTDSSIMFEIDIKNNRQKQYEFQYNGNTILEMLFKDGQKVYKKEIFEMNAQTIDKYQHTGHYKLKNVKPKIKLVHLQTTINDDREQRSRESLEKVREYGWEYHNHSNMPYTSLPPQHNCQRPLCVSMELFDEHRIQLLGTALTPAHYGCYESFKNAILKEFHDCDFLILCEGDCKIEVLLHEFVDKVHKICELVNEHNIGFMSFGDTHTLEHKWVQSPIVQKIDNQDLIFITNHIIGLQCIMFPKFASSWLKDKMLNTYWDASDMFFNSIFVNSPYKMGIVHNRLTTQFDGYSLIDQQQKTFL
jgi:hypothetical protein